MVMGWNGMGWDGDDDDDDDDDENGGTMFPISIYTNA